MEHQRWMGTALRQEVRELFEMVASVQLQAVPAQVAADTLRLVNPTLGAEAEAIVAACGGGTVHQASGALPDSAFAEAMGRALDGADPDGAVTVLRDIVRTMRAAFRQRYLMYDAPPNEAPAFLFENELSLGHFRKLFAAAAAGSGGQPSEWITRRQIRDLLARILPSERRAAGASVAKAAMGPGGREESIGFEEFMMVVQPLTREVPLSTLVAGLTRAPGPQGPSHSHGDISRASSVVSVVSASPAEARSVARSHRGGRWIDQFMDSPAPPTSTTAAGTAALKADLAKMQVDNDAAQDDFERLITTTRAAPQLFEQSVSLPRRIDRSVSRAGVAAADFPIVSVSPSAASRHSPSRQRADPAAAAEQEEAMARLEEEIGRLRVENSNLKRDLLAARVTVMAASEPKERRLLSSPVGERRQGGAPSNADREREHDDMQSDGTFRIGQLEAELRECKARLSIHAADRELYALLVRADDRSSALRQFFVSEKPLLERHRALRDLGDTIDPSTPQGMLLTQYELLVCAYQALYRERGREGNASTSTPVGRVLSAGVVPARGRSRSPSLGASRSRSQRSVAATTTSVRHRSPPASSILTRRVAVSPFRWSEVDVPVGREHWNTGTLGDPVLTREERDVLRAKLASQMRSAARTRSPHLRKNARHVPVPAEAVKGALTSQEAAFRLQSIATTAAKHRSLDNGPEHRR